MAHLGSNQLISLRDALQVIPEFDGQNIPVSLFIEGCQEAKNLLPENAESNLAKLARIKLKNEAFRCVRGYKFETIAALTQFIWKIYMPAKSVFQLQGEIGYSYQKDEENVIAYANRLRDLESQVLNVHKMTNDGIIDEVYKMSIQREVARCFKLGLKPEIEQRMSDSENIDDAMEKAINIERYLAERLALREQAREKLLKSQSSHEDSRVAQNVKVMPTEAIQCHTTDSCFRNPYNQSCYPHQQQNNLKLSDSCQRFEHIIATSSQKVCTFCKKLGHLLEECKRKTYKDNQRIKHQKSRNVNNLLQMNAKSGSSQNRKQREVLSITAQEEVKIQVPSLRLQSVNEVTENSNAREEEIEVQVPMVKFQLFDEITSTNSNETTNINYNEIIEITNTNFNESNENTNTNFNEINGITNTNFYERDINEYSAFSESTLTHADNIEDQDNPYTFVSSESKQLNVDQIENQEIINMPFVFSESNNIAHANKIEEQGNTPFASSELKQLCSDKIENQGEYEVNVKVNEIENCYVIKDEKINNGRITQNKSLLKSNDLNYDLDVEGREYVENLMQKNKVSSELFVSNSIKNESQEENVSFESTKPKKCYEAKNKNRKENTSFEYSEPRNCYEVKNKSQCHERNKRELNHNQGKPENPESLVSPIIEECYVIKDEKDNDIEKCYVTKNEKDDVYSECSKSRNCYEVKVENRKNNVSSEFSVFNSQNCSKIDKVENRENKMPIEFSVLNSKCCVVKNQSQSNQNSGIKKISVSPMFEKRDVICNQNEIERLDKINELLSLYRSNARGKKSVEKLENEDKRHMSGNDFNTKNGLKHQNLINAHQNRLSQPFQGETNSQVQKCTDENMVQSFVSLYIALNWKTRKKFDVQYCLAL